MLKEAITIDIDTGGTFTDGFFFKGERVERVKVETTPHDLTVCFLDCIEEGARILGFESAKEMLKHTEVIRISTTLSINTILQRKGSKLGLIVTKGFEENLYSSQGENPSLGSIISRDMIIGIEEEVEPEGGIVKAPNEGEVKRGVKSLLEGGARVIAVSLQNAPFNRDNERKIKEIIEADYPTHYLGSVPVFLSTEVDIRGNDFRRTNALLLSSYVHSNVSRYLYKADEELRQKGYRKPLLVVHSNGGVTRVAKTRAIDTYNSGPVAGLFGSLYMANLLRIGKVVTLDIGGTSTDMGFIWNGEHRYTYNSRIVEIPIGLPFLEVSSIGAGGGSIAKLAEGEFLVGPESAGSLPGPASYDLGGLSPTVTDASLVLGLINPDFFLGGRKKLNKEAAHRTIKQYISEPLGIAVEEASYKIIQKLQSNIAEALGKLFPQRGWNPKDFVTFAFGGAGGCFCCAVAESLNIQKIYTFNHNSVFNAFGSSTMDLAHLYETFKRIVLKGKEGYTSEYDGFNQTVEEMKKSAYMDTRGEGFKPENVVFKLELELEGNGFPQFIPSPREFLKDEEDVKAICASILGQALHTPDEIATEILRLEASCSLAHFHPRVYKPKGEDSSKAIKSRRRVYWEDGFKDTPIYAQHFLECGNVVKGPAVIESTDTTYIIPLGWRYVVDNYLNGMIVYNREE